MLLWRQAASLQAEYDSNIKSLKGVQEIARPNSKQQRRAGQVSSLFQSQPLLKLIKALHIVHVLIACNIQPLSAAVMKLLNIWAAGIICMQAAD